MTNQQQLDLLKQEQATLWNTWREEHPDIAIELNLVDLSEANLGEVNLSEADLRSNVSEVPVGEEASDTRSSALSSIARDTVTTSVRESIKINGGHLIRVNIMADNRILHVIDKLLVPAFMVL